MASPEAIAIRDAEHKERQSSAMEALRDDVASLHAKLDTVLELFSGTKPKPAAASK